MPYRDINNWTTFIPFLGLVTKPEIPTPIIMRIVEAAIIGGVIMFGTMQSIGKDIDWIKAELYEVRRDVKDLHSEAHQRK